MNGHLVVAWVEVEPSQDGSSHARRLNELDKLGLEATGKWFPTVVRCSRAELSKQTIGVVAAAAKAHHAARHSSPRARPLRTATNGRQTVGAPIPMF